MFDIQQPEWARTTTLTRSHKVTDRRREDPDVFARRLRDGKLIHLWRLAQQKTRHCGASNFAPSVPSREAVCERLWIHFRHWERSVRIVVKSSNDGVAGRISLQS